jgi:acetoin utilization protein AcuC
LTCNLGVLEGKELLSYSFPPPHPFTKERIERYWEALRQTGIKYRKLEPVPADEAVIELFHSKEHYRYVETASHLGYGSLDQGDTPVFRGVLDAARFVVGSTLLAVEKVMEKEVDHAFNPMGGLHHARRNASAGFCVFNDIGVAIEVLRKRYSLNRILYADIDVHHGDGVYYSYESDPNVWVFDLHEDGRYIYPGTGSATERGRSVAEGTKVNVPLVPGSGDDEVGLALPALRDFAEKAKPEFIIFQSGADCLANDPLGGLECSPKTHGSVTKLLHRLSHDLCAGRIVALGGGGYDVENCARAWIEVTRSMVAEA